MKLYFNSKIVFTRLNSIMKRTNKKLLNFNHDKNYKKNFD